ncbi:MAG: DNA-directed RNA polymerase subunit alpha, partial [Gemmatimonadota bacterium]|nr:DNA-directed RNA polymerase subunit alpha [Gemmatimonadota bacterium]
PLERGFGHTIGNSIRRILLSSLPGAAVWAIRADGVQHEHQTVDAVAEDVHQIIQNLKGLVLIMDADVDEAKLELSVRKAGVVTAAAIQKHPSVEVVNPDHVLFTLQEDQPENRPLTMDLWVDRGRGFVMAEHHVDLDDPERAGEFPVGMIRIDSVYNPVTRANFAVHETRVGQRTDFDRLEVDVETNGALDPADAIAQAAEIARLHLSYFSQLGIVPTLPEAEDGAPVGGDAQQPLEASLVALLERPLDEFEQISARSRNTLERQNISTLGDVVTQSRDDILNLENFGEKSLEEIAEVLAENGLRFGMAFERDEAGNLYLADDSTENGAGSEE